MKKFITFCMCGCIGMLQAQEATFVVTEKSAERVGDKLAVTMRINVSDMEIPKSRSLVCTPLIESGY